MKNLGALLLFAFLVVAAVIAVANERARGIVEQRAVTMAADSLGVELSRSHARCDSLSALLVECRAHRRAPAPRFRARHRVECATGAACAVERRPGLWHRCSHWIVPVACLGVGVVCGAQLHAADVIQTTIVTIANGGSGGHGEKHGHACPPPKPKRCAPRRAKC